MDNTGSFLDNQEKILII